MSAMRDAFETALDHMKTEVEAVKAEIAKLLGHALPEVHAVAENITASAEKLGTAVAQLQGDVPVVEAEAKADVVKVAADAVAAEAPVAKEAVTDGEHLAGEIKTDVETAAKDA